MPKSSIRMVSWGFDKSVSSLFRSRATFLSVSTKKMDRQACISIVSALPSSDTIHLRLGHMCFANSPVARFLNFAASSIDLLLPFKASTRLTLGFRFLGISESLASPATSRGVTESRQEACEQESSPSTESCASPGSISAAPAFPSFAFTSFLFRFSVLLAGEPWRFVEDQHISEFWLITWAEALETSSLAPEAEMLS
eukprot:758242-Hanusia_phi.AAC.3